MTRDPMTVVDAMRPETTPLDQPWADRALASVMAAPRDLPVRRTRRTGVVLAGAAGIGLLGAGAAAAAGLTPQDFAQAFRDWGVVSPEAEPERQAVDPATARRVASTPGPGTTTFTIVAAPGRDGFSCVAALFETPDSLASPTPSEFLDANGSQCADRPPAGTGFGDQAALDVQRQPDVLGARDVRVLSLSAGRAVRAVVRSADGSAHPLLRFEGRFYGWFEGSGDRTPPAEVVGYAADGTVVGRTRS